MEWALVSRIIVTLYWVNLQSCRWSKVHYYDYIYYGQNLPLIGRRWSSSPQAFCIEDIPSSQFHPSTCHKDTSGCRGSTSRSFSEVFEIDLIDMYCHLPHWDRPRSYHHHAARGYVHLQRPDVWRRVVELRLPTFSPPGRLKGVSVMSRRMACTRYFGLHGEVTAEGFNLGGQGGIVSPLLLPEKIQWIIRHITDSLTLSYIWSLQRRQDVCL